MHEYVDIWTSNSKTYIWLISGHRIQNLIFEPGPIGTQDSGPGTWGPREPDPRTQTKDPGLGTGPGDTGHPTTQACQTPHYMEVSS